MLMPAPIRNLYERWLARRLPPARQVVLDQRRIFIFPTGYGFFYLLVSALLFIGGINYDCTRSCIDINMSLTGSYVNFTTV